MVPRLLDASKAPQHSPFVVRQWNKSPCLFASWTFKASWELHEDKPASPLPPSVRRFGVSFSPLNHKFLASSGPTGKLVFLDHEQRKTIKVLDTGHTLTTTEFIDGVYFAAGTASGPAWLGVPFIVRALFSFLKVAYKRRASFAPAGAPCPARRPLTCRSTVVGACGGLRRARGGARVRPAQFAESGDGAAAAQPARDRHPLPPRFLAVLLGVLNVLRRASRLSLVFCHHPTTSAAGVCHRAC